MSELFQQLGIDWRLLLSQAANFLILLILLTFLVYKPVLKILKDRKTKIEDGLQKAEESENRLREANLMAQQKVKEAEGEALEMMRKTERKAKDIEAVMLAQAKEKEKELFRNAELAMENKRTEAMDAVKKEAAEMVKKAIARTVELSPEKIDEALIKKAVSEI